MEQYYILEPTSNDIYHHGVLGQKWGDKNGPPYPLTPFNHSKREKKRGWKKSLSKYKKRVQSSKDRDKRILKKGQEFQRIGGANEKDQGRTYVSYLKEDNDAYMGYGIAHLLGGGDTKILMKSIKDINIADSKSTFDTFLDIYRDTSLTDLVNAVNPEIKNSKGEVTRKSKITRNVDLRTFRDALDSDKNLKIAYNKFQRGLMNRNDVSAAYFKKLENLGFDAMVDLNDITSAKDPLIIFDRSKNLKVIKETSINSLSDKERATYIVAADRLINSLKEERLKNNTK